MSSRGVNRAIIIGNLGVDPDVKYMPSGGQVTNIRVATSEQWKDKNTGEAKENTEWHRIVFFGKLAEIAGEYLKKGSQVYIEGRLQTRKWQGQDGQDRFTTEIVANEMQMLGGKPSSNGQATQAQQGGGYGQPAQQQQPPAQANYGGQQQPQQQGYPQQQQGYATPPGQQPGYGEPPQATGHQGTGGPPPHDGFGEDDIPFGPVDGRYA